VQAHALQLIPGKAWTLRDSLAATKAALDSIPRSAPAYSQQYAVFGRLTDSLRAAQGRVDRTRIALDAVTESLEPVQMLPAPAQGALAVECRAGDSELVAVLAELDDADTRAAVTAERALLAELEAGCSAPVGAIAEVVESIDEDGRVFEELSLRGCVATLDGSDVIRASGIGSPERARELGLSTNTVRNHMVQAIALLRSYLQQYGKLAVLLLLLGPDFY